MWDVAVLHTKQNSIVFSAIWCNPIVLFAIDVDYIDKMNQPNHIMPAEKKYKPWP